MKVLYPNKKQANLVGFVKQEGKSIGKQNQAIQVFRTLETLALFGL